MPFRVQSSEFSERGEKCLRTQNAELRTREDGQVFPVIVIGLLVSVLLTWTVVKVGSTFYERTRLQTAVDATALSTANAYARGMNIVAVSNQLLFAAAVGDAALKLLGGLMIKLGLPMGGSLTDMVMLFQDIWAGTGNMAPGIAPLAMQAAGHAIGARNGLEVTLYWNGGTNVDSRLPVMNLRRASLLDLIVWLAGGKTYDLPEGSRTSIPIATEEDVFSYQPSSGGPRVEVPADQVEKVEFERRGKKVTAYRVKSKGGKAGKFVKAGKVSKVTDALDIPLPLIETSPVHEVLVVGRGGGGDGAMAAAETGGGEVFNEFYGDPSYGARLLKIAPGALAAVAETSPPPGPARPAYSSAPDPRRRF